MTQARIICFCVLLLFCTVIASLECGPNEQEMDCASECESDYCPTETSSRQACPTPKNCPSPVCKCQFNYSRLPNGTCVPTRECPPFECSGKHEVFNSCPPFCSDDCSVATRNGECPPSFFFILIVVPCSPACRCQKGYWKKNGTCVPYDQCKK